MSNPEPEYVRFYEHIKSVFGGYKQMRPRRKRGSAEARAATVPFGPGREPKGMTDVLGVFTHTMGWDVQLARSEVMERWEEIAGEEIAIHCTPADITDGMLTVNCDSTAWATQMRLMKAELLTQITLRLPEAGVENMRFTGPNVPSFKRGPRSVQGRGVRDTYG